MRAQGGTHATQPTAQQSTRWSYGDVDDVTPGICCAGSLTSSGAMNSCAARGARASSPVGTPACGEVTGQAGGLGEARKRMQSWAALGGALTRARPHQRANAAHGRGLHEIQRQPKITQLQDANGTVTITAWAASHRHCDARVGAQREGAKVPRWYHEGGCAVNTAAPRAAAAGLRASPPGLGRRR